MDGKLRLSEGEHWLDGKPVALNAALELRLSANRWLRCQYRWSGDPEQQPVFSVVLGGAWENDLLASSSALRAAPEAVLRVEIEDAEFRWPESN